MRPTPRALRIGVLLGDNLVEERLIRAGSPVTFGYSLRCTLSVPVDGVPAEHVLFDAAHALHAPPGATGRIVQGGAEVALQGMIPVTHGTRGKLRIGEATVLFQEVPAPAIAPLPQLPAAVRGSLLDRVDRRLGVIVAASLVAHLGIAGWAWLEDLETRSLAEEVAAQYEAPRYEIMEVEAPDLALPSPPDNTEPGPGVAKPANPAVQTPKPSQRPAPDRMPEPDNPDAWAQLLTGNRPGALGQHEIPNRLPDTDLDKQIKHLADGNRVISEPSRRSRDDGMRLGTGGSLLPAETHDPKGSFYTPKQEQSPIARITPVPQPRPVGRELLSINLVLGRIQNAYLAGLQRCYVKHGLAVDAAMVAKVTLSFVIDDHGIATENQASGASPDVDTCIRTQMAGWRFPIPKDADGDPTDAPFKLVLALQPS